LARDGRQKCGSRSVRCHGGLGYPAGILAYRDHFLFPYQLAEVGVPAGLPFAWHFGMWGDLVVISPLAFYIVLRFRQQWRLRHIAVSVFLGLIFSALLSWSYIFSTIPEAHVRNHSLTGVGQIHLVYMLMALAIFTLFYWFTSKVSFGLASLVSVLLILHVFVGTHMALSLLNTRLALPWYTGRPTESALGWLLIVATAGVLGWRTMVMTHPFVKLEFWLSKQSGTWYSKTAHWFIRAVMAENTRSVRDRFKLLDTICKLFGFSFISALILLFKRDSNLLFPFWMEARPVSDYRSDSAVLLVLCGLKYHQSRLSVKKELDIAEKLYPPGRVPRVWGPPGRSTVAVFEVLMFMLGYGIVIVLLLFGWFIPVTVSWRV
jgi:hypothetical protein